MRIMGESAMQAGATPKPLGPLCLIDNALNEAHDVVSRVNATIDDIFGVEPIAGKAGSEPPQPQGRVPLLAATAESLRSRMMTLRERLNRLQDTL